MAISRASPQRSAVTRIRVLPKLMLRDHAVDDAVLLGLLGAHEVVALGVLARPSRASCPVCLAMISSRRRRTSMISLARGSRCRSPDLGSSMRPGGSGSWRSAAPCASLGAAGEQQRAHRHRDADADRLHVGLDELHRVVDREARVDRAAGRVDVDARCPCRDPRTRGAAAGRR